MINMDRENKKARAQIDAALESARTVALAEVERLARAVLRNRSSGAKIFVMCMGSATFYHADGRVLDIENEHGRVRRWARPIYTFLDDYGDTFGLWGEPLRLDSADAEVRTDW
jgi:type II secretory pathway pseudopilin PulG